MAMIIKLPLAFALVAGFASPAAAKEFPAADVAAYYNDGMGVVPRGFRLSYAGREGATHVFVLDRNLDAFPATETLTPIGQLRRLLCGDTTLRAWIANGTVARIDARDRRGGKTVVTRGPTLSGCA